MWLDQWLVQQAAKLFYWRYAGALRGEMYKWQRLAEENRHQRLLAALGSYGEDITIRAGVQILAPDQVHLGNHVGIGYNSILQGKGGITLGDFTLIGDNNILATNSHPIAEVHFHNFWDKPIHIKENAWLGANVIVLPGVTIGENAVVGAGAVVTVDVPPNSVVVGVPARVVKTFTVDDAAFAAQKRQIRAVRLRRIGSDSPIDAIFED